jgi:hypothetical protein
MARLTSELNIMPTALNKVSRRDVKNDERTDYVYENTGNMTKCTLQKRPFLHENVPIDRQSTKIGRASWLNMHESREKSRPSDAIKACPSGREGLGLWSHGLGERVVGKKAKNEGSSGYVYENNRGIFRTLMTGHGIWDAGLGFQSQESGGKLLRGNCIK